MVRYSKTTRLPMLLDQTSELEIEMSQVYEDFKQANSFEERLDAITAAMDIEERIGGFFKLLSGDIKLSPSAFSYIRQLIKSINEEKPMDDMCYSDRLALLRHCDTVVYTKPEWTEEESVTIKRLSLLPLSATVHVFTEGPGIGKYFELLRIRLLDELVV